MKTIVATTDFSQAASNATDYAADMAMAMNANLLLLHVYQLPVTYGDVPLPLYGEDLTEGATSRLDKLREELLIRTGGKVSIKVEVKTGGFFQELKTACEEQQPFAVLLGSQGSSAAEHLFFGSHTLYAMKHLTWPIIAVPLGASFSAIKKIGLACDFEKIVHTIPIDEIKALVNDFHAELHVINTGKIDEFNPDVVYESEVLKERLPGINPNYHYLTTENTDQGIMDFAEKNQIDLLLVLPRRHSLFDKLVHKSHTRQFVLHCPIPLMALHQ